ncbi:MAG: hypothetical protein IBJ18_05265 [Phycisphaerales bacterium]|nr:hypothetical protein [Phycisphaerales bacterium]
MVVSSSVLMIMLLATAGVVRMVSASASQSSPVAAANSAAAALSRLAQELATASVIDTSVENAITFTAPTAAGGTSTITWAWSGVKDGELTRADENTSVRIATGVRGFSHATVINESADVCTQEQAGESLISSQTYVASGYDVLRASSTAHAAQYLLLNLPTDTLSWKPTRLRIMVGRSSSADSTLRVAIMSAAGITPSSSPTTYASTTMAETALPSSESMTEITFNTNRAISAQESVALVLSGADTNEAARIAVARYASGTAKGTASSSSNAGSSWTSASGPGMVYQLYAITTGRATTTKSTRAASIMLTLQINPGATASANVLLTNQPTITGAGK